MGRTRLGARDGAARNPRLQDSRPLVTVPDTHGHTPQPTPPCATPARAHAGHATGRAICSAPHLCPSHVSLSIFFHSLERSLYLVPTWASYMVTFPHLQQAQSSPLQVRNAPYPTRAGYSPRTHACPSLWVCYKARVHLCVSHNSKCTCTQHRPGHSGRWASCGPLGFSCLWRPCAGTQDR